MAKLVLLLALLVAVAAASNTAEEKQLEKEIAEAILSIQPSAGVAGSKIESDAKKTEDALESSELLKKETPAVHEAVKSGDAAAAPETRRPHKPCPAGWVWHGEKRGCVRVDIS